MRLFAPVEFNVNENTNPSSGAVRAYGDLAGGRAQVHVRRPSHRANFIQNYLGRNRAILATAQGDTTTIDTAGASFLTTGTVTAAVTDSASLIASQRRVDLLRTSAATNNVAGIYASAAQFYRGDAADRGGFYMAFRWGVATGQAGTTRAFCGVSSVTSAPTDADPSGIANIVGMGWDSADSEIQIMHRTGTGTTQKYGLYSGIWPVPTADNSVFFLFELYCPPNGSGISWRIEDPVTGAYDFGTFFTDIPADNTMLAPRIYQSVGGVNSVIGMTFMNFYAESDT